MSHESRAVSPGPRDRTVRTEDGEILTVPDDWQLLPPGDAALTRRVKAGTASWTVKEKKGRRTFSKGVWASAAFIEAARDRLDTERSTDSYAKKRKAEVARRERKQSEYVQEFEAAVLHFLDFAPEHIALAQKLAVAVTTHATPVGSGTVARTQRIPVERRAEAAVIAWLRHATTSYDDMKVPRVKGKRREVRRMLAERSRRLLKAYRTGEAMDDQCPLRTALSRNEKS